MEATAKRAALGLAALRKAAEEPGVVITPSGLVFRHIKEGTGPSPGPSDRVTVFYHGGLLTRVGIYAWHGNGAGIKCTAVLAWL